MNMKGRIAVSALAIWALGACQDGPRTVENPLIETANSLTLDITRVELTDTATWLQVDAYRAKDWIRITSDACLQAEGQTYALTGTQDITPDSDFWMPASGKATFHLRFEPLPLRTRSFDFIQKAEGKDCFKLFGIDLTGKATYDTPESVPQTARAMDGAAPMPAPVFRCGETSLTIHLLGWHKDMMQELPIALVNTWGKTKKYTSPIDPENNTATYRFMQYGTMPVWISTGSLIWLAPGEKADIYLDLRVNGRHIADRRTGIRQSPLRRLYATGTYANLNNVWNSGLPDRRSYSLNAHSEGFADYRIDGASYVARVGERYQTVSDSLQADTLLPPLAKEAMQLSLEGEALIAIGQADLIRRNDFLKRHAGQDWNLLSMPDIAPVRPEQAAVVARWFDLNNPQWLLMPFPGQSFTIDFLDNTKEAWLDDWQEAAGLHKGFIPSLRQFNRLARKVQNNTLTDTDLAVFTPEESFYADALRTMRQAVQKELAALAEKAVIQPVPDVPADRLFEAILAPYKGKVVFVDFWNTWCAPCRSAIEHLEPLKDTTLKNDNLVWLYIANETSPLTTYRTMIPGIRGQHYRLTNEQWDALCKPLKIGAIPAYVLVDKDGTYARRDDLMDTRLLIKTLKDKLNNP